MQPTPSITRLRQLAQALKTATDEANAALQRPLAPWGESEEDRAQTVLALYIDAILAAMLQHACDGQTLTPAMLINQFERMVRSDLNLFRLQSCIADPAREIAVSLSAIPVVGYIASDPESGDNAHVFFYNRGEE